MANRSFSGGISLEREAYAARKRPIRTLRPGTNEVELSCRQSAGRPAIPIVLPGDRVKVGSLVARADGNLSANLHSSVSGKVLRVSETALPDGSKEQSILIEDDRAYEEIAYPKNREPGDLNRESLIRAVKDAGLVGFGGAAMPTAVKLAESSEDGIDTIIANCAECEPSEAGVFRQIAENPWAVIDGMMILLEVFPRARGYVAVSDDNPDGFKKLKDLIREQPRLYVRRTDSRYPSGSERQVIFAMTGRTLSSRMLPGDIGCLVFNGLTLAALSEAFIEHRPVTSRLVTISGPGMRTQSVCRVPLGMTYRDLIEHAGGLRRGGKLEEHTILDGGLMSGHIVKNPDAPITKKTGPVYVSAKRGGGLFSDVQTPCIHCGACLDACPNRLFAYKLFRFAKRNKTEDFVRSYGLECNGCGCCSYVCPARIDLAGTIYEERAALLKSGAHPEYVRRSDKQ